MESVSAFPFRKLRFEIYLTLEVMMYIDHQDAYKFMFSINKVGRNFFITNFIALRNGFINDGLVDLCFDNNHYGQFSYYH